MSFLPRPSLHFLLVGPAAGAHVPYDLSILGRSFGFKGFQRWVKLMQPTVRLLSSLKEITLDSLHSRDGRSAASCDNILFFSGFSDIHYSRWRTPEQAGEARANTKTRLLPMSVRHLFLLEGTRRGHRLPHSVCTVAELSEKHNLSYL